MAAGRNQRKATKAVSKQPNNTAVFVMGCMAALALALVLYQPALHSPFIFDDNHLPYRTTSAVKPLTFWIAGVRPLLMATYWLNYRLGGDDTFGYHAFNLMIHAFNSGLVFLVLFRLLNLAGWDRRGTGVIAMIGASFFLIHPLQTEAVTYIAGRSESLSALFVLLAYVIFLYRRQQSISWLEAIAVLALFGLGVSTKENAVALGGVLLLTDLFWGPQDWRARLRANWRLYSLMGPLALAASIGVFRLLSTANSAGFSLKDVQWPMYALTEGRAVARYVQLAVLPVGQSIDHDFPFSRTIWDYGAIFFVALWAALLAAAVLLRRRLPVSCFGLLLFATFLAPTSSFVPLLDPLVERRMYLPLIGLILIAIDVLARLRLSRPVLAGIVAMLLFVYAAFCYARNQEWAHPDRLWASAATECVRNVRPYVALVEYYIAHDQCRSAIPYLEEASRKTQNKNATLLVSWGRVLECIGDREGALQKLQQAAVMGTDSSQVFQLIGLLYSEMNMPEEAGEALRKAVAVAPNSTTAHNALGLWYESMHDTQSAEREYRKAASLDPNDFEWRMGLARIHNSASPKSLGRFDQFVPQ